MVLRYVYLEDIHKLKNIYIYIYYYYYTGFDIWIRGQHKFGKEDNMIAPVHPMWNLAIGPI